MRRLRTPLIALGLALLILPAALAAEKMQVPRETGRDQELTKLPPRSLPAGGYGTEGLGPGGPAKLAALSSWITSDLMPDDFTTDDYWIDTENLSVAGSYFTSRNRPVKVLFQILDEYRYVIAEARFEDAFPYVNDVNTWVWDLQGSLSPGLYQARVKFRQGKKTLVGVRYWFVVFPTAVP